MSFCPLLPVRGARQRESSSTRSWQRVPCAFTSGFGFARQSAEGGEFQGAFEYVHLSVEACRQFYQGCDGVQLYDREGKPEDAGSYYVVVRCNRRSLVSDRVHLTLEPEKTENNPKIAIGKYEKARNIK